MARENFHRVKVKKILRKKYPNSLINIFLKRLERGTIRRMVDEWFSLLISLLLKRVFKKYDEMLKVYVAE
jgi:hypothetical protein